MQTNRQTLAETDTTVGLIELLAGKRLVIDEECERFINIGDAEALHDLRVAMRRLHSLFIAFAPAIDPAATFPRELRLLQKGTNQARDLEVTLDILRNSHLELPWLEQQWQQQLEDEYRYLRQTLPAAWHALAPALDTPQAMLRKQLPPQPLGELAADLLQAGSKQLEKRRKSVCRHWKDKSAHKLRILGKQLRYLLEPFNDEVAACAKAVQQLKQFQDLLGDYHDIVVLRDKLKRLQQDAEPAQAKQLKRARKQLKQNRQSLRKQVLADYCAKKGKKLHKSLTKTGRALANS